MLTFTSINTNITDCVHRASVPGGWLVIVSSYVTHVEKGQVVGNEWDWRTSVTFVPDPLHAWEVK